MGRPARPLPYCDATRRRRRRAHGSLCDCVSRKVHGCLKTYTMVRVAYVPWRDRRERNVSPAGPGQRRMEVVQVDSAGLQDRGHVGRLGSKV